MVLGLTETLEYKRNNTIFISAFRESGTLKVYNMLVMRRMVESTNSSAGKIPGF
jgi:hypothetical protein